jgi:misacylated tRNA(Ala) deacylase
MRHHTALHVIDAVVYHGYKGNITGGQIYTNRARLDFDVPDLNKEKVIEIICRAQVLVDKGLPVSAKMLSQEEALKIPDLARTKPGEELLRSLQTVRVVEISGLDFQMDGGTHVANTKEIGKIELSSYENKGATRKRIEIVLSSL